MKTVIFSAMALCAIGASRADEPAQAKKPIEFPEKIFKAWKEAGAQPGWMRVKENGHTGFLQDKEYVTADDLPAFNLHRFKPGVLATLPDPGIPFGLRCNFSNITDDGVKELVGLKSLTVLSLSSTKVTGAAFKSVAELPNLEALYLAYNNERITGAGLGELVKLKKLRQLDLGATSTNDAGMKELAKLEGLTRLSLYYTKITDAGMAELTGWKGLVWLNMSNAPVGDAAMKIVAQNKDLQSLNLFEVKITDAGVKELIGLQKLEKLTLSQPSSVSIEELKRALPKCVVNY